MSESTESSDLSDPSFAYLEWLSEVEKRSLSVFALALSDLPDMPTRAAFDEGTSPEFFFEKTLVPTLREVHGAFVDAVLCDAPPARPSGTTGAG